MPRVDLREKKAPAVSAEGITLNRPPLPTTPFIIPTKLTPAEEATLRKSGWQPGDPVPIPTASLSPENQRLAEATRRAATENLPPPAPLDTPPLQMPDVLDASTLSPDRQQDLAAALELAKRQKAAIEAAEKNQRPALDPGLAAAISGHIPIVDDRRDRAKPKAAPTPPPPSAPAPEPTTTSETGGDQDEPIKCDHCGWPHGVKDPIEITDFDKRNFVFSMLPGGPQFQHEYEVLGGALAIRIRSLRPDEVDLCHLQAYKELMRNELSAVDYRERVFRLRIALQLSRLVGGGKTVALPESVDDWDVDVEGDNTKLKAIQEYVYLRVVEGESRHRVVAHLVAKFNSLCSRLEARAEDPDFYARIV